MSEMIKGNIYLPPGNINKAENIDWYIYNKAHSAVHKQHQTKLTKTVSDCTTEKCLNHRTYHILLFSFQIQDIKHALKATCGFLSFVCMFYPILVFQILKPNRSRFYSNKNKT